VGIEALSPTRSAIMDDFINDNESTLPVPWFGEPDAHGQAAILLVESLIHGLIARSVITVEDAMEVVTVAIDVAMEIGADFGDCRDSTYKSFAILAAIRESLSIDISRHTT
jgi:hypothetical protein